jgi:cytochrome c oxidase subunit 3
MPILISPPSEQALVHEQFDDIEQQRSAAQLGMWIFLATEVLFFGGLFLGYTVYRYTYGSTFVAASHRLDVVLGGINTAVLLTSSVLMAFAVRAAKLETRQLTAFLLGTVFLGVVFLSIKAVEYHKEFVEHLVPGNGFEWSAPNRFNAELFFWLYFAMTGLHALHLAIGIGVLLVLAILARRGKFSRGKYNPIEVAGLYWHFVDVVWVFLFPLLYLVGHR